MAVAAEDPRIAAVISQALFTDAIPTLLHIPLKTAVRLALAGMRDRWRSRRGHAPLLMPAVGEPGTLAAMTAPDAKRGYEAIGSPTVFVAQRICRAADVAVSVLPTRPHDRAVDHAAAL